VRPAPISLSSDICLECPCLVNIWVARMTWDPDMLASNAPATC
jgi:hypothetical protein